MFRHMLRAKIHGAVITKKSLEYNGSIGIDRIFLEQSGIVSGEKVQVLNSNNGLRFETYVIELEENSKDIVLYGPAARCGEVGDKLYILAYALVSEGDINKIEQKIVYLNNSNEIVK
ncbi:MAG: aspartate 1-decarboxylase [Candidatus Omnitrophota bacterium]|nr:MAG: aspartate 1-decarboxylase [Candidatus Omnitrophota bacterium]